MTARKAVPQKEVSIKQVENGYIMEMRLYKYVMGCHSTEHRKLVHTSIGDLVSCLARFLSKEEEEK